jgi:hypothetical protein
MEVRITPEQEAQLSQIATRIGEKGAQEVVQETVTSMLGHEARFVGAVIGRH